MLDELDKWIFNQFVSSKTTQLSKAPGLTAVTMQPELPELC